MGLWIRSQNKCTLIKIDNIYMTESGFIRTDKEGMSIFLEKYKHDRAKDILNEIQDKLTDKYLLQSNCCVPAKILETRKEYYQVINAAEFIITNNDFDVTPITVGTTVYEMPEE